MKGLGPWARRRNGEPVFAQAVDRLVVGRIAVVVVEEPARTLAGQAPVHRVLVRRVEEDAKTPGGIIIPDTAKEKPQQGEVLAVGPGVRDKDGRRLEPELKAGQKVLFGKWSGSEVRIDGEDLLIMKESDVLGVLDAA